MESKPNNLPSNVTILDEIYRKRFQTLLAVDEMIRNILAKLKEVNCLDNTYVVFTSDNGFHIGKVC